MAAYCSIDGCKKNTHGSKMCPMHRKRVKVHGDPLYVDGTEVGAPQKFFDWAIKQETEACILWPFSIMKFGYGEIHRRGKTRRVHREMCLETRGKPPSKKHETAHCCGKRPCINKRHLRWATREENQADRVIHGTSNRGERQHASKLAQWQAMEIKLAGPIMSSRIMAERYGVAPRTIRDIWNGQTWFWL